MAILQLVGPVEFSRDEIIDLGRSNMIVCEMVVLKQKNPSARGGVIHLSVKRGIEVLEGNLHGSIIT